MDPTGWRQSAEGWIEQVDRGDILRETTLDASMLASLGSVAGERVLDFGCGEGRFSRMLKARGASVAGFDFTPRLARRARERDASIPVAVADGRHAPFRDAAFDAVICYLVLLDIEEFGRAVSEACRVLRPGGRLLDATICPFRTAADQAWVRDDAGRRLHVPVEEYVPARKMRLNWGNISIVNFHRPLEEYLAPFLAEGLVLTELREPVPHGEADEHDLRVPLGMTTTWRKPA